GHWPVAAAATPARVPVRLIAARQWRIPPAPAPPAPAQSATGLRPGPTPLVAAAGQIQNRLFPAAPARLLWPIAPPAPPVRLNAPPAHSPAPPAPPARLPALHHRITNRAVNWPW